MFTVGIPERAAWLAGLAPPLAVPGRPVSANIERAETMASTSHKDKNITMVLSLFLRKFFMFLAPFINCYYVMD